MFTKGKRTRCSVEECQRLRKEAAAGVAWSQYLPIKHNSELNEIINDIAVLRHCEFTEMTETFINFNVFFDFAAKRGNKRWEVTVSLKFKFMCCEHHKKQSKL